MALGCEADPEDVEATLRCLRKKPAGNILELQPIVNEYPNIFPFLPTTDGTFLTSSPQDLGPML